MKIVPYFTSSSISLLSDILSVRLLVRRFVDCCEIREDAGKISWLSYSNVQDDEAS